jgi:hypothetical protein
LTPGRLAGAMKPSKHTEIHWLGSSNSRMSLVEGRAT